MSWHLPCQSITKMLFWKVSHCLKYSVVCDIFWFCLLVGKNKKSSNFIKKYIFPTFVDQIRTQENKYSAKKPMNINSWLINKEYWHKKKGWCYRCQKLAGWPYRLVLTVEAFLSPHIVTQKTKQPSPPAPAPAPAPAPPHNHIWRTNSILIDPRIDQEFHLPPPTLCSLNSACYNVIVLSGTRRSREKEEDRLGGGVKYLCGANVWASGVRRLAQWGR